MSKIPRPSPRSLRELPISDDEKRAALPFMNQKKMVPNLKKNVVNEEIKKQENKTVKPKEDSKQKQPKKAITSSVAIPSSSKGPAIFAKLPVHKTLNRSKTEPSLKLGYACIEKKEKKTNFQPKQVTFFQPDVCKTKVSKGVSRLKQKLSFGDKKLPQVDGSKIENIQIPNKKQSKTTISSAALPSTTRGPAVLSEVTIHRALNRSKTEPSLKLGHVSVQEKEVINNSQAKQAANYQPDVPTNVSKNISGLKKSLSFRNKKPSSLEDPKKSQIPFSSKTKIKPGDAQVATFNLKATRTESFKVSKNQVHNNSNRNMNRSKTESSLNFENVNKEKFCSKKTTEPNITPKVNKKNENVERPKSDRSKKVEIIQSDEKKNIQEGLPFQVKFESPGEFPHGGLRFTGKRRITKT